MDFGSTVKERTEGLLGQLGVNVGGGRRRRASVASNAGSDAGGDVELANPTASSGRTHKGFSKLSSVEENPLHAEQRPQTPQAPSQALQPSSAVDASKGKPAAPAIATATVTSNTVSQSSQPFKQQSARTAGPQSQQSTAAASSGRPPLPNQNLDVSVAALLELDDPPAPPAPPVPQLSKRGTQAPPAPAPAPAPVNPYRGVSTHGSEPASTGPQAGERRRVPSDDLVDV